MLPREKEILDSLAVKKMYVKYFDVDWDAGNNEAVPIATIDFSSPFDTCREIIPVVFMTNKTFLNLPADKIQDLSSKVIKRIYQINQDNKLHCTEIQFDCDWTEKTKKSYFSFIECIKMEIPKEKYILSATIRLHQVKYLKKTGVPPVDRGMLMFYNMGSLNDMKTSNSIFNIVDAEKYTEYIDDYPLPLDAVLPVFSWGIHIRDGKVMGLVNNLLAADVLKNKMFVQIDSSRFKALDGLFMNGEYFIKNDILRMEEITPEACCAAAALLQPHLKTSNFAISLFHFNSPDSSRYAVSSFENIYSHFN